MLIEIKKIIPNPEQPRKTFDKNDLAALADSIKTHGLINPISVEDAGSHYILIDGERRWRASQMIGLVEIEASVRPGLNGAGQMQRSILAITANIQREDMNATDKAEAFQKLISMGLNLSEVAKTVGLSVGSVGNYMLILRLPQPVQELIRARKLNANRPAVTALLGLDDAEMINAAARGAANRGMSESEIIIFCRRMKAGKHVSEKRKAAKSAAELSSTWAGKWSMIAQAGNPAMPDTLREAAVATCKSCALSEDASPKICRECPAVTLLSKLVVRK